VIKAGRQSRVEPIFFIIGFYLLLIGSKIIVALISERAKHLVKSTWYLTIIKVLGFVLIFLAVLLLIDGIRMFHTA
jgi:small neutral amino acid transporter SnatA (MarC family)